MIGGPIERLKVRLRDDLYYSQLPREILGRVNLWRSRFARSSAEKLYRALQAYRFSESAGIRAAGLRAFRSHAEGSIWKDEEVGWARHAEQLRDPALTRTVILKAPGEGGEKGVLLLTFEYNWLRLFHGISDFRKLERDYDIILSTSSSPSNYALLGLALQVMEGEVLVQVCNFSEIEEVEALHPRIRCLPMLPCDWIEPSFYTPRPHAERDVDILMVAGWAPVKRQWQFYQALARMPRDLRVVMIGQAEGPYDLDHAKRQAKLFGAKQDIEFHQSMPIEEVSAYQCRARISLIFSRREGCCVAVTESLFADTPVGLISDAHIGPRAYINGETGVLIDRAGDVGSQLLEFLARSADFAPRAWAKRNIACEVTAEKLNDFLRARAEAADRPWTKEILAPCWRAHPTMIHNPRHAELEPAYEELHRKFPRVFPSDLMQMSGR